MIPRAVWTMAAAVLIGLVGAPPMTVPVSVPPAGSAGTGVFPPGVGLPGHLPNDHIQHVISVMMENHDYDSYFATYCQVLGPFCSNTGNGIPAGTCVPYYPWNVSLGCEVPYNFTAAQFLIPDMEHDWYSGSAAMDGGKMDGFYLAEGTNNSLGHYNQSTVPIYWDMAEQYAIGDNFWGGNLSWSLPNHWYWLAGAAPAVAFTYGIYNSIYLNESNQTRTVQDLLNRTNLTWKYYDTPLSSSYVTAVSATGTWGTAYDYWNPMAARAETYTRPYSGHFVDRNRLIADLQGGRLPNVSWVIPDFAYTDHPGWNNSYGQGWFAQLVDAVENSSYWNSTAIFITWDDFGGFYDHVAPPSILGHRLSFRSPIIVISPYAKENYISHEQTSFMSILHFIEWQFGLGCLTPLDCLAPLPLDFFNFNQTARAPILFPIWWQNASYPMPLQRLGPLNLHCPQCRGLDSALWAPTNLSVGLARNPD